MTSRPDADQAIRSLVPRLHGESVFIAGSCAVAAREGKPDAWADLDIFTPSFGLLMSTVRTLLDAGYTMDERNDRIWYTYQRADHLKWHTNTIHLFSPEDVDTNVVFKKVKGHVPQSTMALLETFDFGVTGVGFDVEDHRWIDIRPVLLDGRNGTYEMLPAKRKAWTRGLISLYSGLRGPDRWLKYFDKYGYDGTLVTDQMIEGYRNSARIYAASPRQDKLTTAQIFLATADLLERGDVDELRRAMANVDYSDPLETILESLE